MRKRINGKYAIISLVVLLAIISSYLIFEYFSFPQISFPFLPFLKPASQVKDVEKFSSEQDFKNYLQSAEVEGARTEDILVKTAFPGAEILSPLADGRGAGGEAPARVSETTVQVPGIDEPDIIKTDGKEIYFSPSYVWRILGGGMGWEEGMIMPPEPQSKINIIKAFPPADLALEAKIDKSGDLLLSKDILVVFSGENIYGYDISNPKSPEKKWDVKLGKNSAISGARLYQDKIYLVSRVSVNKNRPCPIEPLSLNGTPLTIKCVDIYHPVTPLLVDVTFVAMVLDPSNGKVEKNISFVGSSGSSLVYMSDKAVYVTYSYFESMIKFFAIFLEEKCQDLAPEWLIGKIKKLEGYDISQEAKLLEFQIVFENYKNSLSDDERLRVENEFSNRLSDYYKENKRKLEKTGIVKIGLEPFEIKASGSIPGYPVNQFALDEYKNYLRIATTVGQGWWGWPGMGRAESANDVYVLDGNLKIQGQVQNLGLTERIYSVRFIEDKGYLVTFRETDPFYVLDLSQPQKPQLKGELKIPGYSSYLHPISKDKILGIGKENWQVKISLFDVSSIEKPKESDKYVLDEYWSDVLSTHHAFLLDGDHGIFFLPGGKGGYIFSFGDDDLKLVRAVSQISVKRALYINDYLYVVGDNKITVLNEMNWETVKELEF